MTAATLSRPPSSAGSALTGSLARGGVWTINRIVDFGLWGVGQFLRAPVAITLVVAAVGFSILAGSNLLFMQTGRLPAPLFFSAPKAMQAPKPVGSPVRPRQRPAIDNETTGSVGGEIPRFGQIGNADVLALQKKLAALHLFDGTPDGLYGRRTATALKAFEVKTGLPPRGKLTTEVLAAIDAAPLPAGSSMAVATAAPAMTLRPAPLPSAAAKTAPVAVAQAAPIPLAPLRSPAVAPTPTPAAPTATAADPNDTLDANSLPQADASAEPAATPADTAAAPALAIAAPTGRPAAAEQQVASIDPPAAQTTATDSDGSAMTMNRVPVASTPVAAPPATVAAPAVAAASPTPDPVAVSTLVTPAQKLAAQMGTLPPDATPTAPASVVADTGDDDSGSIDPVLITKIQRALASLGFLGAKIDGQPGEATAKAIRNFEVFYNYPVTGLATPQMLDLLVQHGATI